MREEDIHRDHAEHAEELLATYVGGTASEEDRAAAEALVAACGECRMEVELAVQARAALQTLPELDAPGLADERLMPSAERRVEPSAARRGALAGLREWSWDRVAWGAGIVVAGSLVAILFLVQLSGRSAQEQAGRARGAAPERLGPRSGDGPNYNPASLDALSQRLATAERRALAAQQPAAATSDEATQNLASRDRPVNCLRRGGGLPSDSRPVHIERAAFRGVPAFIGAFQSGGPGSPRYLLVLAVDRQTCDALYVINRSL